LLSLADYRWLIEQNDNSDDQASAVTCDPSAIVNEGSISDPVDDATQGAEDDSMIQADDDNDVYVTLRRNPIIFSFDYFQTRLRLRSLLMNRNMMKLCMMHLNLPKIIKVDIS